MAWVRHGVDLVIWLIIGTAEPPVFNHSIHRLVRAIAKRSTQQIILGSTVSGSAVRAPYIYVLFFGCKLP